MNLKIKTAFLFPKKNLMYEVLNSFYKNLNVRVRRRKFTRNSNVIVLTFVLALFNKLEKENRTTNFK